VTSRAAPLRIVPVASPTSIASNGAVDGDAMGELKVPGRGRYDEAARRERLAWLRERTNVPLEALETMRLVPERLSSNVENAIGAVEVPVGIAGPLLFAGEMARGILYAPLATTEGALVASAARGATAITRAGGVRTRVIAQRMCRAPSFAFASRRDAFAFAAWIVDQLDVLRAKTREVSRHAVLRSAEPTVDGSVVHVVFSYETGDAAGQNMTTGTTWHACQWILAELPRVGCAPTCFLIDGNMSSDKKVGARIPDGGRGCAVVAECTLDEDALTRVLKVSSEELLRSHRIMQSGAAAAGMATFNINVANIIAALFTATGQDIACVHESSLGTLELMSVPAGVAARLTLPGLVVGTVGGGTGLPAQRALLDAMGCTGPGTVRKLAEIIAGFCLALDLSTMAAITTGEFATAHERLGRNRPVEPLTERDLVPSLFERGVRAVTGDSALRVRCVEALDDGGGASILGDLASRRFSRAIGIFHRRVHHTRGVSDVVVKVKPLDAEVILMMQGLAAGCGRAVGDAFARFANELGFRGSHSRELAIYDQHDPRFVRHVPLVYDVLRDPARETHALILERLHGRVRLMDSADDPSEWTPAAIETAIRGIGAMHGIWMGREAELREQPWLGVAPSTARMTAMQPLWEALARHAADEFPALMGPDDLEAHLALVATIPDWWARLEAMPRTLIHNDFNPRNFGLRTDGDARLCVYDWELATMHVPQHDVAELLAFVLPATANAADVAKYVELHREAVHASGAEVPDAATWRSGFALAARDLLVNRFALYLMAHTARHYGFLERSLRSLRRIIAFDGDRS
jgi:NADP-dependent 3-hydroxy-3-methylglutaryl-CoA reductase